MKFVLILAIIIPLNCWAYEPILISLGTDCEVALNLRKYHLRKHAYPFDWIKTIDFKEVCNLIANGFQDFLNEKLLHIKLDNRVVNTKYNIEYYHDFPTTQNLTLSQEDENAGIIVDNFLDYVSQVEHKFNARIKRFYEILQGPVPIIFFRTHIDKEQAEYFIKVMNENFPKLMYGLIVVHDNKKLHYDWNIAKVANFYVTQKGPLYNWFATAEWEEIFIKLGLKSK